MTGHPPRVAFFDVDETLITVKSMFRFLAFYLRAKGRPPQDYKRLAAELQKLSESGVPRAETNRLYYRAYAGNSMSEAHLIGQEWFAAELAAGELFRPEVADALQRHRAGGELTVLVSGSFPPCLEPIAEHVGADQVECTRPVVVDGRYTGDITVPVIGAGKAAAVRRVMAQIGAVPADCTAYGDHVSDLPMLTAVGHPVVVGSDPVLIARAAADGWRRLESVDLPAR
jgi:HAD superfamily hydrolase (TIGR01490 family)